MTVAVLGASRVQLDPVLHCSHSGVYCVLRMNTIPMNVTGNSNQCAPEHFRYIFCFSFIHSLSNCDWFEKSTQQISLPAILNNRHWATRISVTHTTAVSIGADMWIEILLRCLTPTVWPNLHRRLQKCLGLRTFPGCSAPARHRCCPTSVLRMGRGWEADRWHSVGEGDRAGKGQDGEVVM